MQTLTIVGPNLRDQSKGDFHVHAAGCGDLARQAHWDPMFRQGWTISATSREAVAASIYEDILAENEEAAATDYLEMIHFAPCVKVPQTNKEADEADADELRRAAYAAWIEDGVASRSDLDDLALRAAAQHAQIIGDTSAERAIDAVLEDREARR